MCYARTMPYTDTEKQKQAQAEHYIANKAKYAASSKAARERKKILLAELKKGPCTDCGNSYPPYVMQFDHIGTDKMGDISKMVTKVSWQRVMDEVAKCEVVCANCHAERTHSRLCSGVSTLADNE